MIDINPFVSDLIKQGVLKTPEIIEAFKKIDRADFVPPESKGEAYITRRFQSAKVKQFLSR